MASRYKPASKGYSRVFLIEDRARPDHAPVYQSMFAGGSLEQAFGDITSIEIPSSRRYGDFDEIGVIRGAVERATTSITGRYAGDLASTILRITRRKCPLDVQFHFGFCTDPTIFNIFTKAVVFEDADIIKVATSEVGSLDSGGHAVIDETADVAAKDWYEIVPLNDAERGEDITTKALTDVVICDTVGCSDCGEESSGCEKIYAISLAEAGSPGTPADVVYSLDGGITWFAHDIDTLGAAEDPSGIACVGDYVVVISADSNSIHYVLRREIKAALDPVFQENTTGFVTGGAPNDIWSTGRRAFIVGANGYIYILEDPALGVEVVDAGVAVSDNLLAVHAPTDSFAVAVGENGAIARTVNGTHWETVLPRPVGVGVNLNCVWVKSRLVWLIGTSDGRLLYTTDGGSSFTVKGFPGSGSGVVHDIAFSTPTVGYISHSTALPSGRILRTFSGGHSWVILPEGEDPPYVQQINAIAACWEPNFVVGVGQTGGGSATVVSDSFTDPNATPIDSHTPEIGGPWTILAGAPTIESNMLRLDLNEECAIDTGRSDYVLTIEAKPNSAGTLTRIVFRRQDASNYWYVQIDPNNDQFILVQMALGLPTTHDLVSISLSGGVWYDIVVTLDGSSILATLDGANNLEFTSSAYLTETVIGMSSGVFSSSDYDNLTVVGESDPTGLILVMTPRIPGN